MTVSVRTHNLLQLCWPLGHTQRAGSSYLAHLELLTCPLKSSLALEAYQQRQLRLHVAQLMPVDLNETRPRREEGRYKDGSRGKRIENRPRVEWRWDLMIDI